MARHGERVHFRKTLAAQDVSPHSEGNRSVITSMPDAARVTVCVSLETQ